MADALLTFDSLSMGSPDQGEWEEIRASPLSITAVIPSIVTDVSATLVERINFRRVEGRTARSCSSAGKSP